MRISPFNAPSAETITSSDIARAPVNAFNHRMVADVPAAASNPLQSKVGWFGLNNINCGILGAPLGFLVMYVVSLMGKEPSKEMQDFVDEIRKRKDNF